MRADPVIIAIGVLACAWTPLLETALLPPDEFPQPFAMRVEAPPVGSTTASFPPDPAPRANVGQAFVARKDWAERKVATERPASAPRPTMRKAAARSFRPVPALNLAEVPTPAPAPMPPVAVAPALPFVYFGRIESGDVVHIFLRHGERNLAVKPGDDIDGVYRVERIDSNQIVFAHLPSNTQQVLSLSGAAVQAAAPVPAPAADASAATFTAPVQVIASSQPPTPASVPGL